MRRFVFFATPILLLAALVMLPVPVMAGRFAETELRTAPPSLMDRWELPVLDREGKGVDSGGAETCSPSFNAGLGHWFVDGPWLGVASDTSMFLKDAERPDSTLETDERIVPLCGILLLRYPKGQVRPYVGIGPTLFIGQADGETEILHRVLMGISYSF
jgi:hypothetical protein